MKNLAILGFAVSILLLPLSQCWSGMGLDPTMEGVLSLTPVEDTSLIAVQLAVPVGSAVSGLRWFNNDGSAAFPRVEIVEGDEYGLPDVESVLTSQSNVAGGSLGWSEVEFPVPAGNAETALFAVFHLPAYMERTDAGVGGGPGIGYREGTNSLSAYLGDGEGQWIRLSPSTEMAVDAVLTGGAAFMAGDGSRNGSGAQKAQYETALLPAIPNPANPITNLHFTLARSSQVALTVYNQKGAK